MRRRFVERDMGRSMTVQVLVVSLLLVLGCYCMESVIAPGVPFNVYGYVKDEQGSPVAGASVTVTSPIDQGSTATDSQGRYAVTLSVNGAGDAITVRATSGSNSGSASGTVPSGSSSMRIDVTLHPPAPPPPPPPPPTPTSSVSLLLTKTAITPGESVTITGKVSPARAITVTIELSEDQVTWSYLAQVTSTSAGSYSHAWTPSGAELTYYLRSSIPASGSLPAATSGVVVLQVTMMPGATVRLSNSTALPNGGPCNVFACSSSSSLTMSIDATEKKISITISGPNGTTGTTMIFLPDELLDAYNMTVDDLLFTVDGAEVTPTIVGVPGGYVVTLTYYHSSHVMAVYYATYRIAVTVLDHAGRPVVAGIIVNLVGPVTRSVSTNASGIALFTRLIAGNYAVSALEPGTAGNTSLTVTSSGGLVLRTTIGGLQAQYEELETQYQRLQEAYQQLQTTYQGLLTEQQSLENTYQQLQTEHQELQKEYGDLRMLFVAYAGTSIAVVAALGFLLLRRRRHGQPKQTKEGDYPPPPTP